MRMNITMMNSKNNNLRLFSLKTTVTLKRQDFKVTNHKIFSMQTIMFSKVLQQNLNKKINF